MLTDSKTIKKDIVLRADSQTVSDLIHISQDAVTIDLSCPTSGRVQT